MFTDEVSAEDIRSVVTKCKNKASADSDGIDIMMAKSNNQKS